MKLFHISHKSTEGIWQPSARNEPSGRNREPAIPCICVAPTPEECFRAVWMLHFKEQLPRYNFNLFEAVSPESIITDIDLADYVHDVSFTREHRILTPTRMHKIGEVSFKIETFCEVDGRHYGRQKLPIFTTKRSFK